MATNAGATVPPQTLASTATLTALTAVEATAASAAIATTEQAATAAAAAAAAERWSVTPPQSPYARRCIAKWGLLPPYTTRESEWETYYRERGLLEKLSSKPDIHGETAFDVNLDSARYVVPRILAGCKQLPQREVLVDRIGNSMYKVFAEVTWEDVDNPRSIESRVRVYSPFGNLRSADLDYDFYVRYSSIQSFSSLEVHLRDASHLSAKRPSRRRRTDDPCFHSITVFQQSHNRSRRDIRRLADPTEILGIAGHLLGFEADVSLIKCLKLLLSMATVGYHGDTSTSWILRCYMRENVGDLMAEGEETEDEELEEELDADSNQSWGSEQ